MPLGARPEPCVSSDLLRNPCSYFGRAGSRSTWNHGAPAGTLGFQEDCLWSAQLRSCALPFYTGFPYRLSLQAFYAGALHPQKASRGTARSVFVLRALCAGLRGARPGQSNVRCCTPIVRVRTPSIGTGVKPPGDPRGRHPWRGSTLAPKMKRYGCTISQLAPTGLAWCGTGFVNLHCRHRGEPAQHSPPLALSSGYGLPVGVRESTSPGTITPIACGMTSTSSRVAVPM